MCSSRKILVIYFFVCSFLLSFTACNVETKPPVLVIQDESVVQVPVANDSIVWVLDDLMNLNIDIDTNPNNIGAFPTGEALLYRSAPTILVKDDSHITAASKIRIYFPIEQGETITRVVAKPVRYPRCNNPSKNQYTIIIKLSGRSTGAHTHLASLEVPITPSLLSTYCLGYYTAAIYNANGVIIGVKIVDADIDGVPFNNCSLKQE